MATTIPTKRALIDKSNSTIVGVTAVAAFVIVFCLVASKSLVSQELYQGRVISKSKVALSQLKADVSATQSLTTSYETFENNITNTNCGATTPTNIICGNPTASGPQDGDNAKIVLDALPSVYDFPALTTSIENTINSDGASIDGLTGIDEQVAQQSTQPSGTPQPVAMPFQVSVAGSYSQVQNLISLFEHSIRPIQMQTITLSGDQSDISATITAQTYYQPAKALNISEEAVK
jgi:hypothetical protein